MLKNVQITYQTKKSNELAYLSLDQSEYYAPLESGNHSFELDRIAKFTDPRQYLPVPADDVILLIVVETHPEGECQFRFQYLDSKRVYSVHSIWPNGTEELIHSTDIPPNHYHIIRTVRDINGYWSVVMNLHADYKDENRSMSHFVGPFTFETLRSFWAQLAENSHKHRTLDME